MFFESCLKNHANKSTYCASVAQAGRLKEAAAFLATVLREQPDLSIDGVRANVPYQTTR